MAFEFEFNGGVCNPTKHTQEKFLLFFVVGGKEVPLYQMERDGLVLRTTETGRGYATGNNVVKLFVSQQGFGVRKRYFSFYMQMQEGASPMVTVYPFSGNSVTTYYFKGKVRFLKKPQILKLLDDENESKRWVKRQVTPPISLLRSIIQVDKGDMRKGVRHVRIGKNPRERRVEDEFLD